MEKILAITGCSGKRSGGEFIEVLSKNLDKLEGKFSTNFRILLRETSNKSVLDKLDEYDLRIGEMTDQEFLDNNLSGVDTLVHIAGIRFSKNIIDACIKNNVRRVILVHTAGVYSKYKSASGLYKEADAYVLEKCKEHGIIYTILRPTMIYGSVNDENVIDFCKMVKKFRRMPIVSHARYLVQPVHYQDLADAYFKVLMDEGNTFNQEYDLTGKEPLQLREMLTIIGEKMGKKVKFLRCPFLIAYMGAWGIFLLTFSKRDYREKVQRLCEDRAFDHVKATKDFAFNPRSFSDGVEKEIKELLNCEK